MRFDGLKDSSRKIMDEDAIINGLKSMSPNGIDNWVDNNVTDLNSAKTVLKAILKVIKYLIRKNILQS